MHCEELIRALVKRADVICGRLIAKMFRDHQEVNTRYGGPPLTLGVVLCHPDNAVDWNHVTVIQKERIMLNLLLHKVTFAMRLSVWLPSQMRLAICL